MRIPLEFEAEVHRVQPDGRRVRVRAAWCHRGFGIGVPFRAVNEPEYGATMSGIWSAVQGESPEWGEAPSVSIGGLDRDPEPQLHSWTTFDEAGSLSFDRILQGLAGFRRR